MGCRHEFFQREIDVIMNTWGSRLPDNFDIMYYDGGWEENVIEGNHIKTNVDDGLQATFLKTYNALYQVMMLSKYDWVLRINTSTFVNVPLLDKFIKDVAKRDILYTAELYSLSESPCPEPLDIYARGNAILMSMAMCRILLTEGINLMYLNIVDDVSIGNVLNSYFMKISGNHYGYLDHIKSFPHAWYRCVDQEFDCGHVLSCYGKNGDMNYYNDFITIQTKMYRNRDKEIDNMKSLWDMMKNAPSPSLNVTYNYIDNPSVFIGSIIGYIPYSDWKKIDKNKLYMYEVQHKAIDDKQNSNYNKNEYNKLNSF